MIDVWYWVGKNQILSGINLNVESGEFITLVGPSGAGKSTLLGLIHMANIPTRGRVCVAGLDASSATSRDIAFMRRKVGMVFQDFKLLEDRDVYENVAFALWATGVNRRNIKKRVFQVLAEVGLSHKRYAMVPELSGGEQQRVAIARALANEPFVLLADEPTGNLDPDTTQGIFALLEKINRKGTAVIMASHTADVAERLSARIVCIREGRIVT
ncbi:MAG TPA: ATP-binding cassette domain-containing protein [bacterium]|nr:ATP-binding cassette domain-containing protein [bacterium]